ncbi:MAG TPA: MarR family transcriptional regulator [Solirubrobacteraceae bacterium]|nr:MarR family transcriptional regulator [Solirubrobacteraceae bacterium]
MESAAPTRTRQLDDIAEALPQRVATLTRLFLTRTSPGISRTEAGVMRALSVQPQRITELAGAEGVSQPGITLLVNRLEDRGWVVRETDARDRRAVLVTLTPAGRDVIDGLRAEYRALMHEEMVTLGDEDVETLARAIDVLDVLIERLELREP